MLTNLRSNISLQSLSTTASGGGTFIESWTTTSTIWANVHVSSDLDERYDKAQQVNKYTIRVRKQPINNTQRIVYKNKVLRIESVIDESQRGSMMTIKASEDA
jgi:SPP1 family predicted phage head-tail adaptor